MTYDEILQLYQSSGGTMFQPTMDGSYYDQQAPQPIALPDGRTAFADRDGTIRIAQRTDDNQFNAIETYAPGAQAPVESMERFEPGANARRSLTGAAGILAAPLLVGGAQSLLGGTAGAAAAPAAAAPTAAAGAGAGGASLSELIAAQGLPSAYGAGAAGAGAGGASLSELIAAQGLPSAYGAAGAGATAAGAAASGSSLSQIAQQLGLPATGQAMDFLRNNASWLMPALGAGAAMAGNGDMTASRNSASNTVASGTTQGAQTGQANTAQQSSLAPWLQGYAQDYVGRAQQLANAPTSNQYLDRAGNLLMGADSDPLIQAARAQQQNVIGGGMLNSNPYIDQVARGVGERMGDAYATGTRAGVASRFNNDGNSVAAKSAYGQTQFMGDRAYGDSLGQTMAGLYANNYNTERAAQDAASRNSLNFGTYGQGVANNLSNFGQADWMRPILANQQYGQAINPAFGSQQTGNSNTAQNTWQNVLQNQNTTGTDSSTIQAPNSWMAGLGGAAAGAGIYRTLFPRG